MILLRKVGVGELPKLDFGELTPTRGSQLLELIFENFKRDRELVSILM